MSYIVILMSFQTFFSINNDTCKAPHAQSQSLQSRSTDSSKDTAPTTSGQTKTGPNVTRYGRVVKPITMLQFMIPICLLDNQSDFENSMLKISRHIVPQTLVTRAKSVVRSYKPV